MLTEVQIKKLAKRFRLLDQDRNGYIELADYQAIAQRTAEIFGLDGADPRAANLRFAYTVLHKAMHTGADENRDGRVDEREFIYEAGARMAADPDSFDRAMAGVLRALFAVCDADNDATIGPGELRKLLQTYALSEHDIEVAFSHLDRDSSGGITQAELAQATREFYCSADPDAPGNWFFGDFV